MPAKPKKALEGKALVKEVCRRIRLAMTFWKQHRNARCRGEREKAIALYETLTPEQKERSGRSEQGFQPASSVVPAKSATEFYC